MKNLIIKSSLILFLIAMSCLAGNPQKMLILNDGTYISTYTNDKYKMQLKQTAKQNCRISYYLVPDYQNCTSTNESIDGMETKIAFATYCRAAKDYYSLIVQDLKNKKNLFKVKNASRFSFSPNGDAIVYLADYPGKLNGVKPAGYEDGVWVHNFTTGANEKLASVGVDINWSDHDNNIYIYYGQEVYRYSVQKALLQKTEYKGIYFTHDGKYYSSSCIGDNDFSLLYETATNKRMIEWENLIVDQADNADKTKRNTEYYGYAKCFQFWSKHLNSGVFWVYNNKNIVFDLKQRKVIGVFSGLIKGTNEAGTLAAVNPLMADGSGRIDLTKVGILNLIELTSKYQTKK